MICQDLGDKQESKKSLERALELDKNNAQAYKYRSILESINGDKILAEKSIVKAISIDPNAKDLKLIRFLVEEKHQENHPENNPENNQENPLKNQKRRKHQEINYFFLF